MSEHGNPEKERQSDIDPWLKNSGLLFAQNERKLCLLQRELAKPQKKFGRIPVANLHMFKCFLCPTFWVLSRVKCLSTMQAPRLKLNVVVTKGKIIFLQEGGKVEGKRCVVWLNGGKPDCQSVVLVQNPASPQHKQGHVGKPAGLAWYSAGWQRQQNI